MSEFYIKDEKRYPLNVKSADSAKADLLPYFRWEHRATLGYSTREFMVFTDTFQQKVYIEEIVGGHLEVVNDDNLHKSLVQYSAEKGFLGVFQPILKPETQRMT